MWRGNAIGRVCLSVCLSVMLQLSKALTQKVQFWYALHLQNLHVKFVYKPHRVKVKGAIKESIVSVCRKLLQSEAGESWQLLSYFFTGSRVVTAFD